MGRFCAAQSRLTFKCGPFPLPCLVIIIIYLCIFANCIDRQTCGVTVVVGHDRRDIDNLLSNLAVFLTPGAYCPFYDVCVCVCMCVCCVMRCLTVQRSGGGRGRRWSVSPSTHPTSCCRASCWCGQRIVQCAWSARYGFYCVRSARSIAVCL
jgi:hypothetical protein